jgi:uncharacterized BrkB/YihY/UPF0761 family membrane protein
MTASTVPARCLWIGVIVARVYYIGHVLKRTTGTYAQFGLVIALLIWLHLGAQMTLYAAEINVVVARRLWPRSLLGAPAAPADEKTLRALAKVEERHDTEQIDVEFKR